MSNINKSAWAIFPLLSILSMSPAQLETKATFRQLASVTESKHPRFEKIILKVDKSNPAKEITVDKFLEETGLLNEKLKKERETFKKNLDNKEQVTKQRLKIEAIVADIVVLEEELKILQDKKLLKVEDEDYFKGLVGFKDQAEELLGDLDVNEALVAKTELPKVAEVKPELPVLPKVEEPKKEEPVVVVVPKTEEPKKEEPVVVVVPKTEEPKKEEPVVVVVPKTEEPKKEEPVVVAPKKEEPAVVVVTPKKEEPVVVVPKTEEPKKEEPVVVAPKKEEPKKEICADDKNKVLSQPTTDLMSQNNLIMQQLMQMNQMMMLMLQQQQIYQMQHPYPMGGPVNQNAYQYNAPTDNGNWVFRPSNSRPGMYPDQFQQPMQQYPQYPQQGYNGWGMQPAPYFDMPMAPQPGQFGPQFGFNMQPNLAQMPMVQPPMAPQYGPGPQYHL